MFGKKTVMLAWLTWDQTKGEFDQPAMVLDLISPGDTSLSVDAPLTTGFGTTADPPNSLTPFWIAAFQELCQMGPAVRLRIDFTRGEGMRESQLLERLDQFRSAGFALQEADSVWSVEWPNCEGPTAILDRVHGCGFDYMWRFGDLAVTDSDGASLLILGSRGELDTVAGMFTRLAGQSGFKLEAY